MDIDQIKNKLDLFGVVEIIFEPNKVNKIKIESLVSIIERSKINLRGWDFPHLPLSNEETSERPYSIGKGIEFYTDWEKFIEIFRFYQSGQFWAQFALYEDTDTDYFNRRHLRLGAYLDFISIIYRFTEIVLFIKNVIEHTDIEGGNINIKISKMKDRILEPIFSPNILSFDDQYVCHINSISCKVEFSRDEILTNNLEIARGLIKQVFNAFNWMNSSDQMILTHQENLISRRI